MVQHIWGLNKKVINGRPVDRYTFWLKHKGHGNKMYNMGRISISGTKMKTVTYDRGSRDKKVIARNLKETQAKSFVRGYIRAVSPKGKIVKGYQSCWG